MTLSICWHPLGLARLAPTANAYINTVPAIIMQFPGARIMSKHLDLADFGSVRSFADEVLADNKPIHLLINDAGRYIDTPFTVTKDGFEIQVHEAARVVCISSLTDALDYSDGTCCRCEGLLKLPTLMPHTT